MGNLRGVVRKISVRATTVETFDNVSSLSRTRSSPTAETSATGASCAVMAIGVAYGTDPKLVERLRLKWRSPSRIVRRPQPSSCSWILRTAR
ncbi:MAG: hypothetical protein ACLRWP_21060 [Bilophila wadsworthia]